MIEIDPEASTPPFEQLRLQITAAVRSGNLKAGARLPAVRQLADDLRLSAGTVAKAYQELERDGVVTTHGQRGTFVADFAGTSEDITKHTKRLSSAAEEFVRAARSAGLGANDAVAVIREHFRR